MKKNKIICIGDSIVKGDLGDSRQVGWVGRLQEKMIEFNQLQPFYLYNLGVSGTNTKEIDLRARTEGFVREPTMAIISSGMNDLLKDDSINHNLSSELRERHWLKMLSSYKSIGVKVFVLSITPVLDHNNPKLPTNKEIDTYNIQISNWCKNYGISFIDINTAIKENPDFNNLYSDDIHPNTQGYDQISNLVYNKLF